MAFLESLITALAHSLPLEVFVVLGSFLEEVIAPIPSPSILVIAGSFGAVQGYTLGGLALLVLLASIGKTAGGFTMYWIAHALKDLALRIFGKYIAITEADIEAFGSKFTGTPRDYLIYIAFRATPIIPSVILSFGAGVLRLPLRLFIVGTFVGTLIRDSFYLTVGYLGTTVLHNYLASTTSVESRVEMFTYIACVAFVIYIIMRKRRAHI